MKYLTLFKRFYATTTKSPKICIVGAGAAGFYAAQHLNKHIKSADIDIYEKLPVPFGLVRFGVAPDHPEVKNVEHTFTKTAENPNVRFYGNVTLGKDLSLRDLKEAYHVVLLTYGAEQNRKLNIPGEDLGNSFAARDIVGWYNGVPWNADLNIDFSGETVAIFGQGNVAIDVARILLAPYAHLKHTDITEHALDALATSRIREVQLIGRRGPLQAAFTIKELREMLKLENCKSSWCVEDFAGVESVVANLQRPKKRITELMLKSLTENSRGERCFKPRFFRSPLEFLGANKIEGVRLGVNRLEGGDFLAQRAVLTEKTEEFGCQMGVTSIGYKSIQVDSEIPFNEKAGTAKSLQGKIGEGLYAAGWLATGPTGVILSTMSNAFGVADRICGDLQTSGLLERHKGGFQEILGKLKGKNVQIVTWNDWLKIDKYEQEEGKKLGKPRKKLLDVGKMLEIAA